MSFMPGAAGVDASAKSMSRYMSDVRRKEKKLFMASERIAALEAERDEARRLAAEAQAKVADDEEDQLGA